MDGVTILSVSQAFSAIAYAAIVLGAVWGVYLIAILLSTLDNWEWAGRTVFTVLILACVWLFVWGVRQPKETQYKVMIDSSVTWEDFNSRYWVKSQEGSIITVREREDQSEH